MNDYYVYLIQSQKRLTIEKQKIINPDYLHLMDNNGVDEEIRLNFCKLFCLGYLLGNKNKKTELVNNPLEFL